MASTANLASADPDVYGPTPFYKILESSFSKSWTPAANDVIDNREHILLLDAATQSYCLSIDSTTSHTLTVTSVSDITSGTGTYGTVLRSMFQILDRHTHELFEESLSGTYSIQPELMSYFSIDADAATGVSAATSLTVRDRASFYMEEQSIIAYLIFTFTGDAESTKVQATTRLIYNAVTEEYEEDPAWSSDQWLVMNSTSVSLTSTEADATEFLLANSFDLIDFSLEDGSDFNAGSIPWQTNSFASYPTDSEGNLAVWDFYDSALFNFFPNKVDDFYQAQFGDSDDAAEAAEQALNAIETMLIAEGSALRYDKSVYLAYRENSLSHRFGAFDIYNAALGERTVADIYFVNATDDDGVYHPFMVIFSHNASGGPNFLIDVARPPGDGTTSGYESQTITRNAILEARITKIPLKDYGLITNLTDNDMAGLGLATLASDAGLPEADWNVLNYAGNAATGIGIDGAKIYPAMNNEIVLATSVAEITSTGLHVGRGMSLHSHADGHGYNGNGINLYNIEDYEGRTHPPLIGFSFDGVAIYGKYESAYSMDGDDVALDEFGGHSHGDYGYHYHAFEGSVTQTISMPTTPPFDVTYNQHYFSVGAWKGDVNEIPGFAVNTENQFEDDDTKKYIGGSNTATATIAVITTQPQDVAITSGDATTLTVVATDASGYQWYSGESGDTTNPIDDATAASVAVSPTTTSTYWVAINGTEGFVTNSDTVTVTVADATSAYEIWAAANVPDATGENEDPDGDGIENIIEYALGLSPTVTDSFPLVLNITTPSAAEYSRPEGGAEGITYILQTSEDLEIWTANTDFSTTSQGNGFETVTHQLSISGMIFVRLNVQSE
ncbi:hypothetical protein [Cerasicoccus frondis]|uniref:hypothetical protein n=1 Tax=Cerasicoccus frondis TaxID=490090 RepID=UPI0028528C25|nr:hypothetical protein [Cerasicoccus frondis]